MLTVVLKFIKKRKKRIILFFPTDVFALLVSQKVMSWFSVKGQRLILSLMTNGETSVVIPSGSSPSRGENKVGEFYFFPRGEVNCSVQCLV